MKLKVDIKPYRLNLKKPFRISRDVYDYKEGSVVSISYDELVGVGETNEHTYYEVTKEKLNSELQLGKNIIEQSTLIHPSELYAQIEKAVTLPFARAAIDNAYWNLYAKWKGVAIQDLFDLSTSLKKPVKTCYTISIDTIENMVAEMERSTFDTFKIKLGTKDDLEIMTVLRQSTKKPFLIDANCGWDIHFAQQFCDRFEGQNISMIEQPFSKDKNDWVKDLKSNTKIPVVADESMTTLEEAKSCLQAFDGINIKLLKCGGITPSLEIMKLALNQNAIVMIGCMMESSIGISSASQLAPWANFVDLDSILFLKEDIPPYVSFDASGNLLAN